MNCHQVTGTSCQRTLAFALRHNSELGVVKRNSGRESREGEGGNGEGTHCVWQNEGKEGRVERFAEDRQCDSETTNGELMKTLLRRRTVFIPDKTTGQILHLGEIYQGGKNAYLVCEMASGRTRRRTILRLGP